MQYKCKLHIEYEVIVSAKGKEAAAIRVFETIGEAVTHGEIPMDLFKTPPDTEPIPLLISVDVTPLKSGISYAEGEITHNERKKTRRSGM